MVMIAGKIVHYNFGSHYDLNIRFSPAFQMQVGMSYDECNNASQLLFQQICHAVQQLQFVEEKNWMLEKIEEIGEWEFPDKKSILENKPVYVIHHMTYAKYQLTVYGKLVLTLRESSDCDFLIDHLDFYDPRVNANGWYNMLFDYAYEHCKRFGRR